MKNSFLIIFISFVLSSFIVKAQQTILLSFEPASSLDSLKIDNLNNGTFQLITGSYSIELQIDIPTYTEFPQSQNEAVFYPNPFKEEANFDFSNGFEAKLNLTVYDLSGKLIAAINQAVNAGSNRFIFKPAHAGMYFIKANCNSKVYSAKIICLEGNASHPKIEYAGLLSSKFEDQRHLKSYSDESTDLLVKMGDMLRFSGYSASRINTIYDFVNSDKSYVFNFLNRYFNFNQHLLEENTPCFVNIIFSVSDSSDRGVDYLSAGDFEILEDNELTLASEIFPHLQKVEKTSIEIKTILLLDNSAGSKEEMQEIKNAALSFVKAKQENQKMAVYMFSDTIELYQKYTTSTYLLERAINKIATDLPDRDLYGSVIYALNQFTDVYASSNVSQGSLIVFTTGGDTKGVNTLTDLQSIRLDKKVFVLGFGESTDSTELNEIANPGPYFRMQNEEEPNEVINTIQSDIVEFSNSVYFLDYMTDKREGEHNVIVRIKDNANTDSSSFLSDSFNAEGFTSGETGVYFKTGDTLIFGLDTIRCYVSRATGISFASDINGANILATGSLSLYPFSLRAVELPEYSWTWSESGSININTVSSSEALLTILNTAGDTIKITLRDEANNFTKDVDLIIYPPEFPDNQGVVLATIKSSSLDEISGISASVKNPGHFWVHNDSGDAVNVYLINRQGYTVATVSIAGITSRDYEDIAIGPGPVEGEIYIYIADIGDLDKEHTYKYIYRIPEPVIDTMVLQQRISLKRDVVSAFTFTYADGPRDAEILMIDPDTKDLYIVTKRETNVQIYTMSYPQIDGDTLNLIRSEVTLPFRMTNGGDISADGTEILIKNLTTVYYWKRKEGESVIDALSRKAASLPYIQEPQGEAIGWLRDGSGYVTVSEERDNIKPLLYLYRR